MQTKKIRLLDKYILPIETKEQFISYINDQKKILVAIQPRKIISKDAELTRIINENIGYPDGAGTVKALARKGVESIKYPGFKLWVDIIRHYYQEKSFYLIGAREQVIQDTVKKLKTEFPGIDIKNFRNGFMNKEEFSELKSDVITKQPDIIFVAMGSPKQEYIMDNMIKDYPALYVGLGGSFDVYAGHVKEVPVWWEKYIGPEVLYRILQDPKKIKRQVKFIPYLYYYLTNKL